MKMRIPVFNRQKQNSSASENGDFSATEGYRPKRPSWVLKKVGNLIGPSGPPGSSQRSARPSSWMGVGCWPLPQTPSPLLAFVSSILPPNENSWARRWGRTGSESGGDEEGGTAEGGTVVGVLAVGAGVRECLVAARTAVRLFSTVQTAVLSEVMFVFERALTHAAQERTKTCTHTHTHRHTVHQHSLKLGACPSAPSSKSQLN